MWICEIQRMTGEERERLRDLEMPRIKRKKRNMWSVD